MICRECGREYHPESYGNPILSFGGWDDRYSEWSRRYCLPCAQAVAADNLAKYAKYHNTCGPCPWCGKRWGCNCESYYGGAKKKPMPEKED